MRLIVMLLSFVVSAHVWAGELAKPTGKVILTMSGNIENTKWKVGKPFWISPALRNWVR